MTGLNLLKLGDCFFVDEIGIYGFLLFKKLVVFTVFYGFNIVRVNRSYKLKVSVAELFSVRGFCLIKSHLQPAVFSVDHQVSRTYRNKTFINNPFGGCIWHQIPFAFFAMLGITSNKV